MRATPLIPRFALISVVLTRLGAVGCTEPSGDDQADTAGGTATGTTDPSAPSSTVGDSTDAPGDTDPGDAVCGNGVLEGDEQCDAGPANSDSTPDACRTDCRVAHCADGVLDPALGEECDEGNDNANQPNTCRETCLLPQCGDGVKDTGEPCDDGNAIWGDSCYACSSVYYFVLNSPELADRGEVSILRSTRSGPPVAIVAGDPSLTGIRQLALGAMGATLFALQSVDQVDRVLAFDPVDGALLQEFPVDEATLGYAPELQAMTRGSDGQLWIAALGMGTTRLLTVDPDSGVVAERLGLGSDLGVQDMTADDAGGLYLTTTANTVERVDLLVLASSTFADGSDGLAAPIGIAYDPVQSELWVANNPAGAPSNLLRGDLSGVFTPYSTAGTDLDPFVRGVAIDLGGVVLTTQRDYDRVVAVQNFDAIEEFFTRLVMAPTDLEILDMDR